MRAKAPGILAAALALAAPAAADPGHGPLRVEVANLAYTPADLTIAQGDLVVWEWRGADTSHSVTAEGSTSDSEPGGAPAHDPGARYADPFDQPGTCPYHCRTHPTLMRGTITVTATGPTGTPAPPELRPTDLPTRRAAAPVRRPLTLR